MAETAGKKQFIRICIPVLIGLSILASLKLIFVDYTMDEEYQIVMAYRNLRGDAIFGQMWEPHQTSAFFCIAFMYFYRLIAGTYTGVVIALRVFTTLIQAGLSVWTFLLFRRLTDREEAAFLGILYFNCVPKLIEIPEFSNMQFWFFTVMVLALIHYYYDDRRKNSRIVFLILASVSLALEVLSYPSCLILFPVTIGYILFKSGKNRIRDAIVFVMTDVLCAGVWLFIVLRKITFPELIANIRNMLDFDLTHDLSGATEGKFSGSITYLWQTALLILAIAAVAGILYLILRSLLLKGLDRHAKILAYVILIILVSDLAQCIFWFVLRKGYEYPQIHILVLVLATIYVMLTFSKEPGYRDKIRPYMFGFTGSILSVLAVFYISDLQFYNAIPHGMLAVIFSLPVLAISIRSLMGENGKKFFYMLFLGVLVTTLLGKGASFKAGRDLKSVWNVRGIMKKGPAAGILSDYMCCYIYNSNYVDFMSNIDEGDKVLIVTNMVFSPGTTPYMFGDYEVCHFSIVDPTSYDERLLKYWELYPEKQPDVIVVDCWYGDLMEEEDNWIMNYIENDFGYSEVKDGNYVRFYKR